MKARVINAFGDKTDNDRIYLPGNDYEAAEKRIAELELGGYVKRIAEPEKAEAPEEPEPEKAEQKKRQRKTGKE